jgi:hypothetical protein
MSSTTFPMIMGILAALLILTLAYIGNKGDGKIK